MLAAHILTFTWYQSRAQRKASLLCYLDFDIDALCKTQCGTNGATLSCNILQTISMDRTIVNSEVSIVWPNLANTSPTSPPPQSLVCLCWSWWRHDQHGTAGIVMRKRILSEADLCATPIASTMKSCASTTAFDQLRVHHCSPKSVRSPTQFQKHLSAKENTLK